MRTHLLVVVASLSLVTLAGCSIQSAGPDNGKVAGAANGGSVTAPTFASFAPEAPISAPAPQTHCSPAPALVRNALCVCGSLQPSGALVTESRVDGQAANVGVNGSFTASGGSRVAGSMRVGGELNTSGAVNVSGHVFSRASVGVSGTLQVSGDLAVGGDLRSSGLVGVAGALRVAGTTMKSGTVESASVAPYADSGVLPCGCDAPYDVKGAVDIARTANDNASHGLSPEGVPDAGAAELSLTAGRYYLSSLQDSGARHVRVEGAVQLYIDGDVTNAGDDFFELVAGATLDLFVGGSLQSAGSIRLGDETRPEAFRLYVGGGGTIGISGDANFAGYVYAPAADIDISGTARVDGGLFAKNLRHSGDLTVRYAAVTTQGQQCETPATPAPPTTDAPTLR